VVASLLVACSLAGCGGGSSSADEADGASTGSPSNSAPQSPAASIDVSPSVLPLKLLTSAQLRQQLLTIDDFPPGYSADKLTADDSSDAASHNFCNYKSKPAHAVAKQTFTKDQGLASTVAQVAVRQYTSAAEAKAQIALLKKTLDTCSGESYQGENLKYAVISTPELGESRVGVHLSFEEGSINDYFIQVGAEMVSVGVGGTGLGSETIDDLTALAEKQLAKMPS
jgi:hypothetical protein